MNYGDKHTEDSLVSRLGRLYGIERGLDCGPNIIMDQYWRAYGGEERQDRYFGYYEADFLYITKSDYLYEVEVKISIADFRADQTKNKYHDHPDVRGLYYFVPQELYSRYKNEIRAMCKEKGAGLIVDGYPITTVLKPKVRKEVKPLTDNGYIHYLRLFAKKWVRVRRNNNDN